MWKHGRDLTSYKAANIQAEDRQAPTVTEALPEQRTGVGVWAWDDHLHIKDLTGFSVMSCASHRVSKALPPPWHWAALQTQEGPQHKDFVQPLLLRDYCLSFESCAATAENSVLLLPVAHQNRSTSTCIWSLPHRTISYPFGPSNSDPHRLAPLVPSPATLLWELGFHAWNQTNDFQTIASFIYITKSSS